MATSFFGGAFFGGEFFSVSSGPSPFSVTNSGAGSGGRKKRQPDFWWELSTISFLNRAAIRKRKDAETVSTPTDEKAVPLEPSPAAPPDDDAELKARADAALFKANAEIGRLEAQSAKAKSQKRIAKLEADMARIKNEVMRINEERDILEIVKMMDD